MTTNFELNNSEGTAPGSDYLDLLIVGAGISGIGAAHRIGAANPGLSYAILERRDGIGGTWDLFRYPGIRSDSDIFTLSFPWEPWTRPETVAQGADIRQYLVDTACKHGIDQHIRFGTDVTASDWDSTSDTWTVTAQTPQGERRYRCRYLFFATGYYSYQDPYQPEFPGVADFAGTVVHPQHWPETLDYTGKRVVVIGSGATAISMIPALTKSAAHVVMLQRSPGYVLPQREIDPINNGIRRILPARPAHTVVRWWNVFLTMAVYFISRRAPKRVRKYVRDRAVAALPPGYDVDTHFNPRYDPWDQRFCVSLDDDFYKVIADGSVEVVTDHVARFNHTGIELDSGRQIDADVVITATGLTLQALGGVKLSIDGQQFEPHERWAYKGYLLNDVPNLAWCIGYTNASWTLRADMTARWVAKLLTHMTSHGYTRCYPHLEAAPTKQKPTFDLESGYVQRSPNTLPKSGTRWPWLVRHNFLLDSISHHFDRIEQNMVFDAVGASPLARPKSTV